MKILRGFIFALIGFSICWTAGIYTGVISAGWNQGKDILMFYFSLLVLLILFPVTYFFCNSSIFTRILDKWHGHIHSSFYLFWGFAIYPSLLKGDMIVSAIEFNEKYRIHGAPLVSWVALSSIMALVSSALAYFAIMKIFHIFHSAIFKQ